MLGTATRYSMIALTLAACASTPAPIAPSAKPWEELTQPSERHAIFSSMVGNFEARNKFWIYPGATPGQPPHESTARVENRLEFEGRFLVQRYSYPGTPFSGIAYFGFDNLAQRYQYVWLDSGATAIESMLGERDPSGDITWRARELDPITRADIDVRLVLHVDSDKEHTLERYESPIRGTEQKSMETRFVRLP